MRRMLLGLAALLLGTASAVVGTGNPAAAYYLGYLFGGDGVADWDGDGHADIVAESMANGNLYLFPGDGGRGRLTQPSVQIGNGWNLYRVQGLADWDGDGHQDIIARKDHTIWLYPGQSVRGYSTAPRVQIGNGWSDYDIAGVADWDNDGSQDLIVNQYSTGELWLYPGQSVRGYSYAPWVRLGGGWTDAWAVVGVADHDADGSADIIARHQPTGDLYLCPGNGLRGPTTDACVQIGNGWSPYTIAGIADWDGDGHVDIVTRAPQTGPYASSPRDLWLYPGQSVRGYSTENRELLGTDW